MKKSVSIFIIACIFLMNFVLPVHVVALEEIVDEDFESIESEEIDYSYLRINEAMPNPDGSDTDYEWIEIYSDSSDETDLSDCFIDGKQFDEELVIDGDDYLVIVKDLVDKDDDEQSFEERWGNNSGEWGDCESEDYKVVEMSISMKNSNDSISLMCEGFEDVFEWEESTSGQSFSIDIDGEWTDEYLVTPGSENAPIPEIVYSHDILISEVYPSPNSNEEEWIEFYNFGDSDIDLTNWLLEDNSQKHRFEDLKIIKSKSHFVIENLNITLNNSGEILTLYDPNEEEVDIFEYSSTGKGISNIRIWKEGMYQLSITQSKVPTRDEFNMYIDPSDLFHGVEILTIEEARRKEIGEEVCLSGVITIEVNKLGSKLFYMQDESSGIQVYLSKEDFWQDYKIGNEIKVIGELKESKGEMRVYVNDEKAILLESEEENNFDPKKTATGDVNESLEGMFVFVSGEIIETSGKSFVIDDGSGQVKILIKSSTDIETPEKKKGQFAGVLGIVSQYGDDEGSFRVLPRYASDIVISNEPVEYGEVLAVTGGETSSIILVGTIMMMVFIIYCVRGLKIKD
ncbi:lamin tail domain-containing protein [Patescibacteria group bacterium]